MVKIGKCWLCGGLPENKCPECKADLSPQEVNGGMCFKCGHRWEVEEITPIYLKNTYFWIFSHKTLYIYVLQFN